VCQLLGQSEHVWLVKESHTAIDQVGIRGLGRLSINPTILMIRLLRSLFSITIIVAILLCSPYIIFADDSKDKGNNKSNEEHRSVLDTIFGAERNNKSNNATSTEPTVLSQQTTTAATSTETADDDDHLATTTHEQDPEIPAATATSSNTSVGTTSTSTAATVTPTDASANNNGVPVTGTVTELPKNPAVGNANPLLPDTGGPFNTTGSVTKEKIKEELQEIKSSPILGPIFILKETYDPTNYYAQDRFAPRTTKFLMMYAAISALVGFAMVNDRVRNSIAGFGRRANAGLDDKLAPAKIKRKTYGNQ
jgi:hypothetical protein